MVALELTNPNNHRAERLRVVDPLPQQLHGAESCGGTERMTDPVVIRDGVTLGAGESRQTEYELTLPDGGDGNAGTLGAWDQEHRGRWAELTAEQPNVESWDLTVAVGSTAAIPVAHRYADGSLLGLPALLSSRWPRCRARHATCGRRRGGRC